jgi:hypothetical protein
MPKSLCTCHQTRFVDVTSQVLFLSGSFCARSAFCETTHRLFLTSDAASLFALFTFRTPIIHIRDFVSQPGAHISSVKNQIRHEGRYPGFRNAGSQGDRPSLQCPIRRLPSHPRIIL